MRKLLAIAMLFFALTACAPRPTVRRPVELAKTDVAGYSEQRYNPACKCSTEVAGSYYFIYTKDFIIRTQNLALYKAAVDGHLTAINVVADGTCLGSAVDDAAYHFECIDSYEVD